MLFVRKLHKWLGLIVGLQLLIWTISGATFAWLDHHEVMAEHAVKLPPVSALYADASISDPSTWLQDYTDTSVYEVRLARLLDRWVWRVDTARGIELRDGADGNRLTVDQEMIEQLAVSHFNGNARLRTVRFHSTPTIEAREAGAVWEAAFADERNTSLYFAADDGRLVVARNSTWRIFDFFWMLHTMDYAGRDNFNNPLVICVGMAALWLALSGVLLLTKSFRPTRRVPVA